MQSHEDGNVIILSQADADAISRRLVALMEEIWDSFNRRRIVLRPPTDRTGAKIIPMHRHRHDDVPLDEIF